MNPVDDIWFKGQRVLRTLIQGVAAALPVVVAILLVTQDSIDAAWLAPVLALGVGIQTWLAKIMAIPAVNRWLSLNTPFGSVPKAVARTL